jgi:Aldehyde dehydrogenase family
MVTWNVVPISGTKVFRDLALFPSSRCRAESAPDAASRCVALERTRQKLPAGISSALAQYPLVRMLAFTRWVSTGSTIMALASERAVAVSLELGGKSPNIVFDDADLDAVPDSAWRASLREWTTPTSVAGFQSTVRHGLPVHALRSRRGRVSPSAAASPEGSTAVTSWSLRSSPMSRTACASLRRRSSDLCFARSSSVARTRRCGLPTTLSTAS